MMFHLVSNVQQRSRYIPAYSVTTLAHWPNACERKTQMQLLLTTFSMHQNSCTLSFTKKSCQLVTSFLLLAWRAVHSYVLTTAGDGMDEWSIDQVHEFVTAEFGSKIVQNFKGELRFLYR